MLFDYLAGAALGLLAGFIFNRFAVMQIAKRTTDKQKQDALKKPIVVIGWMFVSALLFAAVIARQGGLIQAKTVEYLIYVSILLNIAAVDFLIRKVPNELLLLLLLAKSIFIAIDLFNRVPLKDSLVIPAIGLAAGLVLFSIPSLIKIPIGAGDVKLSAAIGFCLGYFLYFQSMALMSVMLLVYLAFLLITKKGSIKTLTSMGPYLAFGSVLTMLFPLTNTLAR